jgi:hypothetical protein
VTRGDFNTEEDFVQQKRLVGLIFAIWKQVSLSRNLAFERMSLHSQLFTLGAVFLFLFLAIGIVLAVVFYNLRNQFPVNHRRPYLTLCTFASVALYAVLYFVEGAAAETCPCWVIMIVIGLSMSAYNSILIRTWILWFKHKLTLQYATEDAALTIQRRPTASVSEWYVRNKYLIQDKYLAL